MLKPLKEIKFIKRSGEIQKFDKSKMLTFLEKNKIPQSAAEILINDFFEEIPETVQTSVVIEALVRVASRRISPSTPEFEDYAGILYFEAAKNRDYRGNYPSLRLLSQASNIDWKRVSDFLEDGAIEELDAYMKPERDAKYNYKAAMTFHQKYCKLLKDVPSPVTGEITSIRELPQLTYMRVALFLTAHLQDLEKTKKIYDALSEHKFTLATPIMVNALTFKPQTSSCVLMTVGDDTNSILETNKNLGIASKNLAGVAIDISALRARGDEIIQGVTSGPIPFIKMFESTISAWNQGGTRPGACAIYHDWWHKDVRDLLVLKNNGGTEENRARKLKYSLKINDLFIRKVLEDEEIALISPHDAPELLGVYGPEFEAKYQKYLDDPNIEKIRAREIWRILFKERSETGNIYLFFTDTVNRLTMLNDFIGSSNLCTEVVLPSRPSSNFVSWKS